MENNLKIALVQTDTIWEDIDKNLENLSEKISAIDKDTDLILLPELFTTGFTMNAKQVAETMKGRSVKWMLKKSKAKNCLVIGSLLIADSDNFYNRLVVTFPDGEVKYYDKHHLFSFAGEEKVFTAGSEKLVFKYKGFKICPLICYDLRFPVWARNTEAIDILIYVANWPNARMEAWDTLLKARAIENLCYVIGVNRVGVDNNQLVYSGHSTAIDALGKVMIHFDEGKEKIKTIVVDKQHITETRRKFRFLDDQDMFEIK
ncbi:MAG: nitrilase family protein [Flavobacteriaceae bacterium]|nr:nitrilase family protein [Flavobacteriaceae bacterium]